MRHSSWSCSCGIRGRPRGKLSLLPIPPPQGTRMSFRFRDDESSTGTTIATVLLGAMAGFAVGMYVAQRVGGFGGLTSRFRKTRAGAAERLRYARGADLDEIEDEDELVDEDGEYIGRTEATDAEEDFNGM